MHKCMSVLVQERLRRYDHVFYLPLPPIDQNPTTERSRLLARTTAVDLLTRGLLVELKISYIRLPNLSPDELMDFIPKYIELEGMAGGVPAEAEGAIFTCTERDG